MTGKELIDFIQKNHLEECEVYQDEYEQAEVPVDYVKVGIVSDRKAIIINREYE
jgi:hypothetical protein